MIKNSEIAIYFSEGVAIQCPRRIHHTLIDNNKKYDKAELTTIIYLHRALVVQDRADDVKNLIYRVSYKDKGIRDIDTTQ